MCFKKIKSKKNSKYILLFCYASSALISAAFFIPAFFIDESVTALEGLIATLEVLKFEGIWLLLNLALSAYIFIILFVVKERIRYLKAICILIIALIITGLSIFVWSFFKPLHTIFNSFIIPIQSLYHIYLLWFLWKYK